MRRLALGVVLVVVWLLLWDSPTWGQLAAGSAVAAIVLALVPTGDGGSRLTIPVRPLATLHLVMWFVHQFVVSNLQVVRAALFPKRWVRPGVVRVDLHTHSTTLAALVSNITALTPGLQPVDSTMDPPTIDVHVLSLISEDDVRDMVLRLEELVLAAFGEPSPAAGDRWRETGGPR
jgi:multicomponent Na+:H+ antiporter subunit E